MSRPPAPVTFVALAILLRAPSPAVADGRLPPLPDAPWRAVSLGIENDSFTGDDDGYSSGVGVVVAKGPFRSFAGNVPGPIAAVAGALGIDADDARQRARTYDLAQTLQTPEDITIAAPQPEELPWAASLLAGVTLYAFDERTSDRFRIAAGVVGPLALGEESQKAVHDAIDSDEPEGWDNQLENEPVFLAEATRARRWFARGDAGPLGVDSIALGGVGLGNLRTYASASLIVRVGRGLARSHAVASLLPGRQVNPTVFSSAFDWYAFGGAQFEYVAKDLMVEGNDFSSSASAELDRTRTRFSAGLSGAIGAFGLTFLYADFPGNDEGDAFGSLNLTWRYR